MESEEKYFEVSATQFIIDCAQFLSSATASSNTHGKKIGNKFTESVLKSFDLEKLIKLTENEKLLSSSLINLHFYRLKMDQYPEKTDNYFNLKFFYL